MRVTLDTASNLSAGFLRGNPPDVGLLNYNMEMARFMERGALSDLSDMPEADRIRPEVQELVDQYATYPGRTSVLPYSVAAASVIYNVQIFEDNGIEVPTTWDELIAACDLEAPASRRSTAPSRTRGRSGRAVRLHRRRVDRRRRILSTRCTSSAPRSARLRGLLPEDAPRRSSR